MKYWYLVATIFILCSSAAVFAQNSTGESTKYGGDNASPAIIELRKRIVQKVESNLKHVYSSSRKIVVVTFKLDPNGNASDIRIVTSSNDPDIDKAATDAIYRSTPFGKLPEECSNPFTFDYTFVFNDKASQNG